jgi:RNA polymerase sigma factor (sigma-70 family)
LGTSALDQLSDIDLIDGYLSSQSELMFGELFARYNSKVYSKCYSLLKDDSIAEDLTQEIFLKVFLNLSKFNRKSQFSTWVYSITYNCCIDAIRRGKKEVVISEEDVKLPQEAVEDVSDEELFEIAVDRLQELLDMIPASDKAVLLMKYRDDMAIKEICEIYNTTESAVKMKLKRAKLKVRDLYYKIYPN